MSDINRNCFVFTFFLLTFMPEIFLIIKKLGEYFILKFKNKIKISP